jgi:hypothetical protein
MENTPAEMTNLSWTPELKAFRNYKKNKDWYLEQGLRGVLQYVERSCHQIWRGLRVTNENKTEILRA